MYQFRAPGNNINSEANLAKAKRTSSASKGQADQTRGSRLPMDRALDRQRTTAVASASANSHKPVMSSAKKAMPAAISQSVAHDMEEWKKSMQVERQQRLLAAEQRRQAAAMQERMHQALEQERAQISASPADRLSLHDYRGAVLATRPSAALTKARSASTGSAGRSNSVSGPLVTQHATPIHIPNKRFDPMDVQLRPARSIVKQYMKAPAPFFVRKNKFGTLDGYSDQVAVAAYSASSSPPRNLPWAESPLMDTKPKAAVWRRDVSSKYVEFPTPRSTLLRQSFISQRVQERQSPLASSLAFNRTHTTPHFDHYSHRLVGAPKPRHGAVPTSVADRLQVSPHHRGFEELPSKAVGGPNSSGLDSAPKPLQFAPSPIAQRNGDSRWTDFGQHATVTTTQGANASAASDGATEYYQAAQAFDGGMYSPTLSPPRVISSGVQQSPGRDVEVSPPTPALMRGDLQSQSPVRNSAQPPVEQPRKQPPGPTVSNLLSQMVLPQMRNKRTDLFQGVQTGSNQLPLQIVRDNENVNVPQPEMRKPASTDLRSSEIHDRLERELRQRIGGGGSGGPSNTKHADPAAAPQSLSDSRILLQHLASKRIIR